jgi:hypothetical protein
MPTRSSKTADANQAAKRILDELTGDAPKTLESAKVKATRVAGKRGGNSRAVALTPEQRADIARTAAQARWKKKD